MSGKSVNFKDFDISKLVLHSFSKFDGVPGSMVSEIKYKYNDSTYNIKVNIGKEEKLIIDGKTQRSKNKIKLSDKKKKYEVSLYIKEAAND